MQVQIEITSQAIDLRRALPQDIAGLAGARAEFTGVVRGEEDGRTIAALEYEAYSPMAESVMRQIIENLGLRHPCLFVRVTHRVGIVTVGEAAIHVVAAAPHRAAALALVAEFMDRLKQDVPIWKRRALTAEELVGLKPALEVRMGSTGDPPVPSGHWPDGTGRTSKQETDPLKKSDVLLLPSGGSPLGTGQWPVPPTGTATAPAANRPTSVDQTLGLIGANVRPLEAEAVPLAEAGGRVLRESVCASEDQPSFDRSSMDGYAVRMDDPAMRFRVVDFIRAGDWKPRQLECGQAVQIATGGALPGDGLQVVMKEDVRVDGAEIVILRRDAERNIRFRGEDARAGAVLVSVGTILSPGALALLASVGCVEPIVTHLPRILHLATGNEIVPPAQTPQQGQIRDSNSTLVRAFLGQWRIEPTQMRVPEDEAAAFALLRSSRGNEAQTSKISEPPHVGCYGFEMERADLLLISGGASVGEHDFTRRLLEECGFTIHVSRTTTRPGKPLIFATRGATIAFGLPGNPLAHFVCLNLYVRAALEALLARPRGSAFARGALAHEFQAEANSRETLWPARLAVTNGGIELTPLPWRSSGDLTSLATANALVRIPPGCGTLARGTVIEFAATAP